jgi:hypothetical protein
MNALLCVTTGTNISGSAGIRQEENSKFLHDFTRLLHSRAKCGESSRPQAATAQLACSALQNHARWLALQETHAQHHHDRG